MTTATLRKSGGSIIITVPQLYIEQNHLSAGDSVDLRIDGPCMTVQPARRPRYSLAQLLAEMPEGLPRLPEWENMPPAGQELDW